MVLSVKKLFASTVLMSLAGSAILLTFMVTSGDRTRTVVPTSRTLLVSIPPEIDTTGITVASESDTTGITLASEIDTTGITLASEIDTTGITLASFPRAEKTGSEARNSPHRVQASDHNPVSMMGETRNQSFPLPNMASQPLCDANVPRYKDGRNLTLYYPVPVEKSSCPFLPLSPWESEGSNILFTVRTTLTRSMCRTRLPVLLDTWMSIGNASRFHIVSDGHEPTVEDKAKQMGINYLIIECGRTYARDDLCCKAGEELKVILQPGNEHYDWLCHVDDDMYINQKLLIKYLSKFDPRRQPVYFGRLGTKLKVQPGFSLGIPDREYFWGRGPLYCLSRPMLEVVRPYLVGGRNFARSCNMSKAPEDIAVGLIIGGVLNHTLSSTDLIVPHVFSWIREIDPTTIQDQIAIGHWFGSYPKTAELRLDRTVRVPDALYSIEEDPSRFLSLHCHLYPETAWCLRRRLETGHQP